MIPGQLPQAEMPMSQQEVDAYRLAQYLRNQQLQQAQTDPNTGLAKSAGNLAGIYAGNKLLGSSAATQGGQLTSEGIAAITGENGLFTPIAQNMSVGAPATEAVGSSFAGSALPIGAAAVGTYLAGKAGLDMIKGKKTALPGRVILGMATGGISEIANALLGRETTRDVAKKHTKSLLSQGQDNPAWQAYVQGMRKQHEKAPTGPAFAGGKYNTFDEYKKAGLQADDLTGVYGNLKTFGPDWAGYGMDRQKQIVQALIDADLYKSKKGEVEVTDAVKAQALRDQILKTALPTASKNVSQTSVVAPSSAPIITFTEGVNGTKIPKFSYSPEYLAYKEQQNAKS